MKRILAILVAGGLIVGAILVRDRIDDDDTNDGGGGRSDGEGVALTCATELEGVCRALVSDNDGVSLTIEDPGTTSDRLVELDAGADPGFDAWLVDGPWAQITEDNRRFEQASGAATGTPSEMIARSPAVIVVEEATAISLEGSCSDAVTWRCIGDAEGLRVGIPDPERGDGLAVLAQATASFFGRTDYAANDFADPGFSGWFDRLTDLSAGTQLGRQSPLERAVAQRGLFNTVGALEAQAARLLRTREGYRTIYPEPMVTSDVTLVPRLDGDAASLLDELDRELLVESLAENGWRIDGVAPDGAGADVELPDSSGMPSAGVLQRLREMW